MFTLNEQAAARAFWESGPARLREGAGFYFVRQRSSHMILRRDHHFAQVSVPDHKSLDTGTLAHILDGAGLTVEEFRRLL